MWAFRGRAASLPGVFPKSNRNHSPPRRSGGNLRRLLVDLKPHSNYRKIGDLISSYDLILSNDYVVEGSCKIYRRDSFGKNHLIGVVSAAKKFKTPSVSFQQNVGPILGNKRRQEDGL